jgi:hypothetical protein
MLFSKEAIYSSHLLQLGYLRRSTTCEIHLYDTRVQYTCTLNLLLLHSFDLV